jgi:hypothetical protein
LRCCSAMRSRHWSAALLFPSAMASVMTTLCHARWRLGRGVHRPCSAAHSACYISPYGDAFHCVQFPLPSGNVADKSFYGYPIQGPVAWFSSP